MPTPVGNCRSSAMNAPSATCSTFSTREASARNPATLEVCVYLAASLLTNGDRAGAEWEAGEIRAIRPDFSASKWLENYPMTDARQIELLSKALAELGLR